MRFGFKRPPLLRFLTLRLALRARHSAKMLKSQERGTVGPRVTESTNPRSASKRTGPPGPVMASAFLPSTSRRPDWASALIWASHFAASYSANQRRKRASSSGASASISRSIFSSRVTGVNAVIERFEEALRLGYSTSETRGAS